MSLIGVIATLFMVGLAFSSASAAEISYIGATDFHKSNIKSIPDYIKYHIQLKGPIRKGDVAKLKQTIKSLDIEDKMGNEYDIVLHLNSPGGSFTEGLEIVKSVQGYDGYSLSTVVDDGAKCYSACALIFMAGNYVYKDVYIDRTLHVNGSLGFHAPNIPQDVNIGYNNAIKHVFKLFNLFKKQSISSEAQPFMKQSLFLKLLSKGPGETFNVDTVDKAGRWDIKLEGFRAPRKITREHLWNACQNAIAWQMDLDYVPPDFMEMKTREVNTNFWSSESEPVIQARIFIHGNRVSGFYNDAGCDIEYELGKDPIAPQSWPLSVSVWHNVQPKKFRAIGVQPVWSMYPGHTLLSDISRKK